jgi:hypothetical protein
MSKFIKMVTPSGVAIWPSLGKANTKFNPDGVFEIKLRMDGSDPKVQAFIAQINEARERALATIRAEYEDKLAKASGSGKASAAAALKKLGMADSPIRPYYDEDGNETGDVTIACKLKAKFTKKDGKVGKHEFVPCVDAKKTEFDPREVGVGSGSVCRASITTYPYVVPSTMQAGVAVRLDAVQVIKLVEFGSAGPGFDEEDGDEIDAPIAPPPATPVAPAAPVAPTAPVAVEEDADGDF